MAGGQLHQLLAADKELNRTAGEVSQETQNIFARRQSIYDGSLKTYRAYDEDAQGAKEQDEHEHMETNVVETLRHFMGLYGKKIDAGFQIDQTNMEAKADLVVNGELIATALPAIWFLRSEKQIGEIRQIFMTMPTLDAKYAWDKHESMGEHVFRNEHDLVTFKTKKMLQFKEISQATDKHPAQVEKWFEDMRIGEYTKQMWSGKVTPHQKSRALAMIDAILIGIRRGKAQANKAEHSTGTIAADLTALIFDEMLKDE